MLSVVFKLRKEKNSLKAVINFHQGEIKFSSSLFSFILNTKLGQTAASVIFPCS